MSGFRDAGRTPHEEPVFQISVVARMVGVHQQTLRQYERLGLVEPHRTAGNRRLYSERDVQLVRQALRLMEDLGVNLAGAEVILRMNRQIEEAQRQLAAAHAEIERLRLLVERQDRPGRPGGPGGMR